MRLRPAPASPARSWQRSEPDPPRRCREVDTDTDPVSLPVTAEAEPPSSGMLLLEMHTHSEPGVLVAASQESIETIPKASVEPVGDDESSGGDHNHFHNNMYMDMGALVESNAEPPPLPGAPLQDIYEVETVLDMRLTDEGKREFLIKWRGWGPTWNNWEPEEHILDKRMLRKFNKKRPAAAAKPAAMDDVDSIAVQSKRRCAKHATMKARMTARKEDGQHDDKQEENS